MSSVKSVKVVNEPVGVELSNEHTGSVRRITRTVTEKIAKAANLKYGETSSEMAFGRLCVQYALTDYAGPSGESLFDSQRHKDLGVIASDSLYDGLTEDDIVVISKAANGRLDEDQQKK